MIELTELQASALDELKAFCRKDNKSNYFLLSGAAGSGKSTVINEFINWYIDNKSIILDDVVVTAPTNKAVRVLKRMSVHDKEVEYKTIHSLLGLRPKIDENSGKEVFEKDPSVKATLFNFGIVIVDECSMIDDSLFNQLIESADEQKIIFVGDKAQIPPVNHFHSRPMTKTVQKDLGFTIFELTEIVRQSLNNPIIELATSIRKGTFKRNISSKLNLDGEGIFQLDPKDKDRIFNLIKEKFVSSEFSRNSDYAKILAWRNKTVDQFNELVRSFIYYKGVNKIVVGEKLILNRPVVDDLNKVILYVNDDLVVTNVTVTTKKIYDKELKYYNAEVSKLEDFVPGKPGKHNLCILHEESYARYDDMLKTLKNVALTSKKESRGLAWKKFYEFKDNFNDVSYGYAITTHKGQGSTYDYAFVCYSDIAANPNEVEMQRILYTACTRPSKTLYII